MARRWENPTGKPVRADDPRGAGYYGAPRGDRVHTGTDYCGFEGQLVAAVTRGVVGKLGYCYKDDLTFRYVLLNTDIGYTVRHLYVKPVVLLGEEVACGQVIGHLQTLQDRYPGITDHVHIDIKRADGRWVDPETLIPTT